MQISEYMLHTLLYTASPAGTHIQTHSHGRNHKSCCVQMNNLLAFKVNGKAGTDPNLPGFFQLRIARHSDYHGNLW